MICIIIHYGLVHTGCCWLQAQKMIPSSPHPGLYPANLWDVAGTQWELYCQEHLFKLLFFLASRVMDYHPYTHVVSMELWLMACFGSRLKGFWKMFKFKRIWSGQRGRTSVATKSLALHKTRVVRSWWSIFFLVCRFSSRDYFRWS